MQKKATNTRRKVKQKSVATARSKRNNKATKHRTEYRTAAGKKRYLKRKADGTISDNQSYKRAHGADVKRRSKAERAKKKPTDGGHGVAAQEHEDRFLKEARASVALDGDTREASDKELPEVLDGDLVGDPSQPLDDALAAEAIENEDEGSNVCKTCDGAGVVNAPDDEGSGSDIECSDCDGTGKIVTK